MSEITVTFEQETAESLAAGKAELATEQAAQIARAVARQAVLDRLGITTEEAALLLTTT